MKEPRPRITSARPLESASTVANRWNTRTGSSEDSTVTPEASRMRFVAVAMPASTVSGLEIAYSGSVVLAQRDNVDTDLVGQDRLGHRGADRLRVRDDHALVVSGPVAEAVDAELDLRNIHRVHFVQRFRCVGGVALHGS